MVAGKQKVTKNQHYLPKAYLQFFSHQEKHKKFIYTYFCNQKLTKYIPIEDVCHRPFLYEQKISVPGNHSTQLIAPNEIENSFIDDEGNYITIINKLIHSVNQHKTITLTDAECKKLSLFISKIICRSPEMVHIINYISKEEYKNNPPQLLSIKEKYPKYPDYIFEAAYSQTNLAYFLNGLTQILSDTMDDSRFVVFRATSSSFITSDQPVINIYGSIDGAEYDLMGMPITPNLFLSFVSSKIILSPIIDIDDNQVKLINNRQLRDSTRYIFSHQQNLSELIELENKNQYSTDALIDSGLIDDDDITLYNKVMESYKC